jgi:hypothetical protein
MARARLIRFFGQQGGQYMTLYPVDGARPELTLFGDLRGATGIVPSTGASTDLADLADLASRVDIRPAEPTTVLTCDGPIEVKPRQILFSGPVQVRSFDAQGNPDPTGLSLDSRSMVIDRTPAGTIAGIQADGDIEFGWAGVRGTCDVLAIDVVQTTLQVRGTTRPAVVQLPGEALTVRLLNYNYRTRMATAWKARFKRRPPATTATAAAAAPEVSEATSATTAK